MTASTKTSRSSRSRVPSLAPSYRRGIRWKTTLTLLILGLAVLAVYFPMRTAPGDNTLQGGDYLQLHLFRIRFAQEALFGPHRHLPGWYPRELLGTPFWSDMQNFPLLPTRLVLLRERLAYLSSAQRRRHGHSPAPVFLPPECCADTCLYWKRISPCRCSCGWCTVAW
jgi:hypothetical protein